jgi:hypothetical protein
MRNIRNGSNPKGLGAVAISCIVAKFVERRTLMKIQLAFVLPFVLTAADQTASPERIRRGEDAHVACRDQRLRSPG